MAKVPNYVVQVITEKGFATKEAAQRYMWEQDNQLTKDRKVDAFETHLWEPASPIGAKKVDE